MTTLQTRPPFVSTFLSHSSTDKPLVEAVAQRLGYRGVLAWLDKNELTMGSLDVALKQAVQRQATITLFLSEASLNSSWCKDELQWAIESKEDCEHLLPVYLGNPLKLVRAHDLLRRRFLHRDGNRVDQNGFFNKDNPTKPDPDAVAEEIAKTAYRRSIPPDWSEIAIVLDQRGDGQRQEPTLPPNFANLEIPILTFRPNLQLRQKKELLTGKDWSDMVHAMHVALSTALGTVRGDMRKVRILGNAQTSLIWAIGKHFDRTTSAELYAYDRDGIPVTNKGQIRHTSLTGGNAKSAKLDPDTSNNLSPQLSQVALGIGSQRFIPAARNAVPELPLFWIESGLISDSEQAMQLAADIVASIEQLRQDHGFHEVVLFWTTANHVALLAAANLTSHVIPKIKFMEWNHIQAEYVHLPMPEN